MMNLFMRVNWLASDAKQDSETKSFCFCLFNKSPTIFFWGIEVFFFLVTNFVFTHAPVWAKSKKFMARCFIWLLFSTSLTEQKLFFLWVSNSSNCQKWNHWRYRRYCGSRGGRFTKIHNRLCGHFNSKTSKTIVWQSKTFRKGIFLSYLLIIDLNFIFFRSQKNIKINTTRI